MQNRRQLISLLIECEYNKLVCIKMGDCASREARPTRGITRQQTFQTQLEDLMLRKQQPQLRRKAFSEVEMYQLLSEYFDLFDTDGDGILCYKEIQTMIKRCQHNTNKRRTHKIEISDYEIKSFFTKLDMTGDMKISKEEFYRFYKS